MKLQYSPYSLIKKNKVNAQDQSSTQNGTLIRIYESDSVWGVADLCPWPSLGDLSLQQEVAQKGILFQRALQLAQEDLEARKQKKSLLSDRWIDNNILVTDYLNFDFHLPQWAGHTFKIKCDKQLFRLIQILQDAPKNLIFRLDFNAILGRDEAQLFFEQISDAIQIEYIEDPCGYDEIQWQQWNQKIPLAADFVAAEDHFAIKIVKPSREEIPKEKSYVITSAMDHPVGVAHALRIAQAQQGVAAKKSGLLTLGLYDSTPFDHYFSYQNLSEMNFSSMARNDFGIGMTETLHHLNWKDHL